MRLYNVSEYNSRYTQKNSTISKLFGFDENTFINPNKVSSSYDRVELLFNKISELDNMKSYNIIKEMYSCRKEIFKKESNMIIQEKESHNILYNIISCFIGTIEFEYCLEAYTNILNYFRYKIILHDLEAAMNKFNSKICKIEYKMAQFLFSKFFYINTFVFTSEHNYNISCCIIITYIRKCRHFILKARDMMRDFEYRNTYSTAKSNGRSIYKWNIGKTLEAKRIGNSEEEYDEYTSMKQEIVKLFISNRNELRDLINEEIVGFCDTRKKVVNELLSKHIY